MSNHEQEEQGSLTVSKNQEYWGNPQQEIQPEVPQPQQTSTEPVLEEKAEKKTSFGDGVNFGLLAFSLSGLIAMGSMGTLAGPIAIILFILLIYFAITKGWKFLLGYFLVGVIFTIVIVAGLFLLLG
ncbi:MAG: hypothetical protein RSA23_10335 [Carnobacterium sp.]